MSTNATGGQRGASAPAYFVLFVMIKIWKHYRNVVVMAAKSANSPASDTSSSLDTPKTGVPSLVWLKSIPKL